MEVDGAGDAAGAAAPVTQAPEARQSLKDAVKKMAVETDFLGFTPLLRACQVCIIGFCCVCGLGFFFSEVYI
jgi:hypothetical protein